MNGLSLMSINERYRKALVTPSDIRQHLPILRQYADHCLTFLELGVRYATSSLAFLDRVIEANRVEHRVPATYLGIDMQATPQSVEIFNQAHSESIPVRFVDGDSRSLALRETVAQLGWRRFDMMFVDTEHNFEQVRDELDVWADSINTYIAFHDTDLFPGVMEAVRNFLDLRPSWEMAQHFPIDSGLTVIRRKAIDAPR